MNLKSHYKMIISIIIVVVLVSSMVVYFYPHRPDTYYNPDNCTYNLKYFNSDYAVPINSSNSHTLSSYGVYNGNYIYLNSTLIEPLMCPENIPNNGQFYGVLGINITGSIPGINPVSVKIDSPYSFAENITGHVAMKYRAYKYNYYYVVEIDKTNSIVKDNKYYNFTVTAGVGKYIYDKFKIDTVKESAVYGDILKNDEPVKNYSSNMYVEDMNNKDIFTVNITDDIYYMFADKDTNYSFYYMYNGSLKPLDVHTSYKEHRSNYLITGNNTQSIEVNFAYPV